jgi:hypothetical protein
MDNWSTLDRGQVASCIEYFYGPRFLYMVHFLQITLSGGVVGLARVNSHGSDVYNTKSQCKARCGSLKP